MNADFEALKERFKKKLENAGNKKNQFNSDIYPFWNVNFNDEVVIRILRDSNPDNKDVFYVEKCVHTLSVNGKDRNVTCIEKHFQEACPICELSRKYYKAKDKDTGLYYYNKKKYLVKALVIKDPLPADAETKETAVNKVKVFQMNKKLIDKITLEIASQLDFAPWDLENGYDFTIMKVKGDGDHADYIIGSSFARKSTVVSQELVDSFGPTNLAALLPSNPTLEFVQRLLNSHLTGDDTTGDHTEDGVPLAPSANAPSTPAPSPTPLPASDLPKVGETFVAGLETAQAEAPKAEVTSPLDEDEDAIFQKILARKNAAAKAASTA